MVVAEKFTEDTAETGQIQMCLVLACDSRLRPVCRDSKGLGTPNDLEGL